MSTRAERMRFVERLQREVAMAEPLTTPEQRMRVVELMHIEAGLPPPRWPRPRGEPIDDTPWRAARQASLRAQHERLGRYGLALARDGSIRCMKCKEALASIPRGRTFAMGTSGSALAAWHQASGCR